jgi:hypothetical protein
MAINIGRVSSSADSVSGLNEKNLEPCSILHIQYLLGRLSVNYHGLSESYLSYKDPGMLSAQHSLRLSQ